MTGKNFPNLFGQIFAVSLSMIDQNVMNKIRKYKISKLSLKTDEERYMRSCTVEDLNILNSAWRNSRWSSKFDLKTYMFSFASGEVRKWGCMVQYVCGGHARPGNFQYLRPQEQQNLALQDGFFNFLNNVQFIFKYASLLAKGPERPLFSTFSGHT